MTTNIEDESRGNELGMQGEEAHRTCSDPNASQDFVGGIMKIVPEVDVSFWPFGILLVMARWAFKSQNCFHRDQMIG